ncbi:MAG: HAD-IC family P-type ATPase [archaeon]|nr:MAG: HAD-IC family P-type ATPase [archaeon]
MAFFHSMPPEEVLRTLGSGPRGLSNEEAEKRLEKYGRNEIPEKKATNPVFVFLKQFNNLMIYILIVAALISFLIGHVIDTYVIVFVIFVNAAIGFVQEEKAETAIRALKKMIVPHAKVYRGDLVKTDARSLVPGDVILLEEGDRIPADARLLDIKNLRTVESSLTGESFPVDKQLKVFPEKTQLADRKNMVWMGTFVAGGRAKAVVVHTGMQTAIGKVAEDIGKIEKKKTHFKNKTDKLAKQMAIIASAGAFIAFPIGYFVKGIEFSQIFLFTIASLVSGIPEGLPAVMAVVLALGARRMAKRNAIIRTLPATDTLGVVNVIATDKTGTLTENTMNVRRVVLPGQEEIEVSGSGWEPQGNFFQDKKKINPSENRHLSRLLKIASACNNSKVLKKDGRYEIMGDPTEAAILTLAKKASVDGFQDRIDDLPFNPELKYRASLSVLVEGDRKRQIYVVGAPEAVLQHSRYVFRSNVPEEMTKETEEDILGRVNKLTDKAMRVLALAYRDVSSDTKNLSEEMVKDLTFVGIVGMIDPPRPEAKEAVLKAKQAGVRVIMTTGDHKGTAIAIAREIGLVQEETPRALTEQELRELSEQEFEKVVSEVSIFARLTPGMKLRIAETLQKQGKIVAMTGDGVNDAPALKKSDIGVSMGIIGTDVARESSDIVLADDNFASIVNAIEEGRIVFNNVRRSSFFLITTNFAESVTFITGLLMFPKEFSLILLPTQVLWLNLVTDCVTGASLAAEPGHGQVLREKPRKAEEEILNREIVPFLVLMVGIMVFLTIGSYIFYLPQGLEKARTGAFVIMSFTQLFNLLNMRSLKNSVFRIGLLSNRYSVAALLLSVAFLFVVIYIPFLREVLQFSYMGFTEMATLVLISSSVLVAGELYKLLKNQRFLSRKNFEAQETTTPVKNVMKV